ncbi:MAG: leucine-rich repeat domain-containing protein [Mycoplasmataceae bacterium]|nr:leucine-rich repeat domain-containing protein [Mycoplasmataceae bacterium]
MTGNLIINNNIEFIGKYAFELNPNLTSISIPILESLTKINENIFYNSDSNINEIVLSNFPEDLSIYEKWWNDNVFYDVKSNGILNPLIIQLLKNNY